MIRKRILLILFLLVLSTASAGAFASASASPLGMNRKPDDSAEPNNDGLDPKGPEHSEVPLLPPSDPNDTSIPSLKMGEKLKLDHLGPIIINPDGTTRRIENWDTMTEKEREVAWRRISKRNQVRIDTLNKQQISQDL